MEIAAAKFAATRSSSSARTWTNGAEVRDVKPEGRVGTGFGDIQAKKSKKNALRLFPRRRRRVCRRVRATAASSPPALPRPSPSSTPARRQAPSPRHEGRRRARIEVSISKTGKHGHPKANIFGLDVFARAVQRDLPDLAQRADHVPRRVAAHRYRRRPHHAGHERGRSPRRTSAPSARLGTLAASAPTAATPSLSHPPEGKAGVFCETYPSRGARRRRRASTAPDPPTPHRSPRAGIDPATRRVPPRELTARRPVRIPPSPRLDCHAKRAVGTTRSIGSPSSSPPTRETRERRQRRHPLLQMIQQIANAACASA